MCEIIVSGCSTLMWEYTTKHVCITHTNTHGLSVCDVCRMFVCLCVDTSYVCVSCLCVCCMTQWVSWVCWRCLPKLQCGWRFSTNPASLEGLLILTTQFFPCSLLLYQRERMREKQVHRLRVHSFCTHISQTKINLPTSLERLHANALPTTKCHVAPNSVLPSFCLSLCHLVSFFLSFFSPLSLPHSPHLSAALHCWRQQPGSPLYFRVPQIDTGW